jgi:hypothetical protein
MRHALAVAKNLAPGRQLPSERLIAQLLGRLSSRNFLTNARALESQDFTLKVTLQLQETKPTKS